MSLESARNFIAEKSDGIPPQIVWFDNIGCGWYPVHDEEWYHDEYFDKFEKYKSTPLGIAINSFRIGWVNAFTGDSVVDVGVGACHFVDEKHGARGYDISNYGVNQLRDRCLYVNPYEQRVDSITCWDSFEHISDCWRLVEQVDKWIFMSIPIFFSHQDAQKSKHFKPHEHWWYFTHDGIIECMSQVGFTLAGSSTYESVLGREGINTYAFLRS